MDTDLVDDAASLWVIAALHLVGERAERVCDINVERPRWAALMIPFDDPSPHAGKRAVAVPPAFTSQACSGCGVVVQKGLAVRWHARPNCGTSLPRDHDAALYILRLGRNNRGAGQAPQVPT